MSRPFTAKYCAARTLCATCRADPQWRASVGAPDVCPHDVTTPPVQPQFRVRMRKVGCGSCKPVEVVYTAQAEQPQKEKEKEG